MINLFALIFIVFPVITLLLSIAGYFLMKNVYIVPFLVFLSTITMMYTVYNTTFLIWVVVYTLLSLIISVITKQLHLLYKPS
jgi:hypothetical protein